MVVRLEHQNGEWVARSDFDGRVVPRDAGFHWNEYKKYYHTFDPRVAARLREHATREAKIELNRLLIVETPWPGGLSVPNGKELRAWQPDCVRWALSRNRSYLALDPGLGKTPISVVIMNTLEKRATAEKRPAPVFLYICPPFLCRTVEYEFEEWRTFDGPAMIQINERLMKCIQGLNILPDSILALPSVRQHVLEYMADKRRKGHETVLFADEAHRFSNWEALRTQGILGSDPEVIAAKNKRNKNMQYVEPGFHDVCDRVVWLSGTPMQIRPMELYPVLKRSAPETLDFGNRFHFGDRFCQKRWNNFGMTYTAGTVEQIKELSKRIKEKFMLRLKKDLLDLPPKLEELLIIGRDMPTRIKAMEDAILERFEIEDLMKQAVAGKIGLGEGDLHLASYRRLLGFEKVSATAELVDYILETTEGKLIVFGIHPDVLERLANYLFHHSPLLVTGKHTTKGERFDLVNEFQNAESTRLLIANSRSAGVGFTLTRADRVLIMEPDWNAAVNNQAIDRVHRVGQNNSVLAQFVVYRNSLDMKIIKANLRAQKLTKHV